MLEIIGIGRRTARKHDGDIRFRQRIGLDLFAQAGRAEQNGDPTRADIFRNAARAEYEVAELHAADDRVSPG